MKRGALFLLMAVIISSQSLCECSTDKYDVMIDAGSSGSKLKIFKFHINENGKISGIQDVESLQHNLDKV